MNIHKISIFLASVVICIIGITIYLLSPPPDHEPFQDRIELQQFMKTFVEEKDNGFYDYLMAARLYKHFDNEDLKKEFFTFLYQQDNAEPGAAIIDFLQQNQQAIDIVKKANVKEYQVPDIPYYYEKPNLPLTNYGYLVYVMIVQARVKLLQGNLGDAYKDYLEILDFTRNIPRNGTFVSGLISYSLDGLVLTSMRPGLTNLDSQTLESVLHGLIQHEENSVCLSELEQYQKEDILKMVNYMLNNRGNLTYIMETWNQPVTEQAYTEKTWADYRSNIRNNILWISTIVNKNKILKRVENFFDPVIKEADLPLQKDGEKITEDSLKDPVTKTILPSNMGLKRTKQAYGFHAARLRGTILRAGVELYYQKQGTYPSELGDLVHANILDKIPIDPFGGEPFKYIENKIYSIGIDFIDDRATIEFDNDKQNDTTGDLIF